MQVQPIVKTQTSFKLILSPKEKKQRKDQIDKLVSQVLASQSEWQDTKDIDIKMVRKLVTKKYDAIIRQKVLNTL
jgi:citrate lyase gamma subunit